MGEILLKTTNAIKQKANKNPLQEHRKLSLQELLPMDKRTGQVALSCAKSPSCTTTVEEVGMMMMMMMIG